MINQNYDYSDVIRRVNQIEQEYCQDMNAVNRDMEIIGILYGLIQFKVI